MGARAYLHEFLDLVSRETGAKQVHLIAHSMGAALLLEVLRDLKRGPTEAERPVKFNEIILAAPDISRTNFQQIASRISGVATGVTLYASSNDKALKWFSAPISLGESRAGDVPAAGPIVVAGVDTIDISNASTEVFYLNQAPLAIGLRF